METSEPIKPTKELFLDLIKSDIYSKITAFTRLGAFNEEDKFCFRNQLKMLIESTIQAWGFEAFEVNIIGPNDDNNFSIDFSLSLPNGKNAIFGDLDLE